MDIIPVNYAEYGFIIISDIDPTPTEEIEKDVAKYDPLFTGAILIDKTPLYGDLWNRYTSANVIDGRIDKYSYRHHQTIDFILKEILKGYYIQNPKVLDKISEDTKRQVRRGEI